MVMLPIFSSGRNKQENILLVKESLQSLPPRIKEIKSFELGVKINPSALL
ncbi:hypothetical protein [Methanothrix sp.]